MDLFADYEMFKECFCRVVECCSKLQCFIKLANPDSRLFVFKEVETAALSERSQTAICQELPLFLFDTKLGVLCGLVGKPDSVNCCSAGAKIKELTGGELRAS
jgi:hypothetical protein